ncbi:uncharacterized protein PGTG_22579 [Puccinia graminis f. sp. tritici CRL 75-36-700-3]|uniref:Uncharacterized protein n=1 Tax=Puccinia graminis f. sp. tritici (strain CRL 75-36-700-3 / race SCCL) TaxID=418459 RepID=H6QUU0_PUCGT|nr:uncharacterized protein PGTG_22579 [Puccinia graminis f. sp. tritici CRL 75-36-700-3]EHS64852.1 hypothetical protein PGTG_22579 [Puccinia graminis f. sp. tritici CRL 75-36-700-3]
MAADLQDFNGTLAMLIDKKALIAKLKTAKDQKRARQLESEETRGGGKAAQGHRVVNEGKPSKDRRFSLNEIEDFGSSSLINTVARLS